MCLERRKGQELKKRVRGSKNVEDDVFPHSSFYGEFSSEREMFRREWTMDLTKDCEIVNNFASIFDYCFEFLLIFSILVRHHAPLLAYIVSRNDCLRS